MKSIKNLSLLFVLMSFLLVFSNCSKEEAQIPAFLSIDNIRFAPESNQGSASENIQFAFIFINDEFIGGYQLPIDRIPILATGDVNILVRPGVKANGISQNPDVYPPYTDFIATVNFEEEEVTTLEPVVSYKPNVRFALNEDFNSENHKFQIDLDDDPDTRIVIDGDGAFEVKSARISLNSDHNQVIAGTDFIDVLPKNNTPVWLEIDYKTDVPILFGLTGFESISNFEQFPEFGINSNDEWNKIYFDVTQYINLPNFNQYQLFFGASLAEEEGEIFLDNVKLVYFEN